MAQLVRCSDGMVVARRVRFATTRWAKMRGLLGRSMLDADEALVMVGARQVHTIGMRFDIDIVFVDEGWIVNRVVERMAVNRISSRVGDASCAIELCSGAAGSLREGMALSVRPEVRRTRS